MFKYVKKGEHLPNKINKTISTGKDFTGEMQIAVEYDDGIEIEQFAPDGLDTFTVIDRLKQAEQLIKGLSESEEYTITEEGYRDVYRDEHGKFYLNYNNLLCEVVKVYLTP